MLRMSHRCLKNVSPMSRTKCLTDVSVIKTKFSSIRDSNRLRSAAVFSRTVNLKVSSSNTAAAQSATQLLE